VRVFGPKRNAVTKEWRRIHEEERYALYSSKNIITVIKPRRLRWTGHVERMGEKTGAYRVLVGKPEGRRPRRRWEDNIKIDFRTMGREHGLDRYGSGWGQVAGSCECRNECSESKNAGKFLTSGEPIIFSERFLLHGVSKLHML
jgi:hypothetical protein